MSTQQSDAEWSRRHSLIVLGSVFAAAVLLVTGLAYAVVTGLGSSPAAPTATGSVHKTWAPDANGIRGDEYRDAVAAEPMLESRPQDLQPAAPALQRPERIVIGSATRTGPADVPTGFDHTPQGAVGQLAAIETAVLTPMSLEYARDIHTEWAMAGAAFEEWELAASIQAFHASAGTVDGDGTVLLTATPVGAQIKATDGPDWVLACVQLDITVVVVEESRFGYGHCERMQWADDRWMIAPGDLPAQAPSTWPASQRSLDAGWRLWVGQEPDR